jgi:hypothetical protein
MEVAMTVSHDRAVTSASDPLGERLRGRIIGGTNDQSERGGRDGEHGDFAKHDWVLVLAVVV